MKKFTTLIACFSLINAYVRAETTSAETLISPSRVVTEHLTSRVLSEAQLELNPTRSVSIYLPPGYDDQDKNYPVIYYFHSLFWNNEQAFEPGPNSYQTILDNAIEQGNIAPFIMVSANFGSNPYEPTGIFYANSPISGNWIDFITQELIPHVEGKYRILKQQKSRGAAGSFFGGYCALKLGMRFPEIFSSVYAMHPVGTSTGLIPMTQKIDWRIVYTASNMDDLGDSVITRIFVAMAQAYLPNPENPPFYCDFLVGIENNNPKVNTEAVHRLHTNFLLDEQIATYADNLKKLTAIAFDWGRYDENQDHVYANQAFTRQLDEYGIEHEAEEYRGNSWEKNWIKHGRAQDHMLPFFSRSLTFEAL